MKAPVNTYINASNFLCSPEVTRFGAVTVVSSQRLWSPAIKVHVDSMQLLLCTVVTCPSIFFWAMKQASSLNVFLEKTCVGEVESIYFFLFWIIGSLGKLQHFVGMTFPVRYFLIVAIFHFLFTVWHTPAFPWNQTLWGSCTLSWGRSCFPTDFHRAGRWTVGHSLVSQHGRAHAWGECGLMPSSPGWKQLIASVWRSRTLMTSFTMNLFSSTCWGKSP